MKEHSKKTYTFENGYGHFGDNGWSYEISAPRTPRPWVNIVSNGVFGFILSQSGGGYSWRENAQLNRINRWEQDLIKDEWGKFLYIRDCDSGTYWSAAWKPVCAEPDHYVCTHGIGYSTIQSRNNGIESEWTMFVPPNEPVELWIVTVTNRSDRRRRLQLFTYFEWNLGAAPDWHREFHRSFIKTSFDPAANALIATKRLWEVPSTKGHWNRNWEYVAFHGCSAQVLSYDADKESFLGMYGNQRSPRAVSEGMPGAKTGDGLDPVASLQHDVVLGPGESKTLVYSIGAAGTLAEAKKIMARFQGE
ncbi:MAG TPA: glycosyl transferase family 36, partial [Bacteroidota bacterium]